MNKKKKISFFAMLIAMVSFVFIVLPISHAMQRSVLVSLQFLIIGIVAGGNLLIEIQKQPFSLAIVHWFFLFTFFFCGGFTQFATDKFLWNLSASLSEVKLANWIILLWEGCFIFAYNNWRFLRWSNIIKNKKFTRYCISEWKLAVIILVLFISGVYPVLRAGFKVYIVRTMFDENAIYQLIKIKALKTVTYSMIAGTALWSSLSAISHFKQSKSPTSILLMLLASIALLLNVPPFAVPRFEVAAIYGGLLLFHWDKMRKSKVFIYSLAVGLLILFPLLNAFRGTETELITSEGIWRSLGNVSGNFTRADYDAYSMLIYSIRYVREFGVVLGQQLLGALLFFIPRVVWPNKPVGSGAMIIEKMAIGVHPNVSCPIVAEGYLNFGIIGVVIFSFVLANATKSFDQYFWQQAKNMQLAFIPMLYTCTLPFLLFMLRGDLMSTFAFFSGFVVSLFLFRKIIISPVDINCDVNGGNNSDNENS